MKSKIFVFFTLILVGILFGITSCKDINNPNQLNLTINLDLSNLTDKQDSQEFLLKVLAYDAAGYKNGSDIEKLPLLVQAESKVDKNGNVKVSLEVEIGAKVIFVAKLYQMKDGKESESPLYAGNSEVIEIKATDNKVHINLKKIQNDTNNDTENGNHTHTFAEDWSVNATHHWKWANCGCDVVSAKTEHTFVDWNVTKEASCTEKGERKATCTICSYEKTEVTDKAEHTFGIWKVETVPTDAKRTCSICNFKETKQIITRPVNFALIPAGRFPMGSNAGDSDEKPVHEVTITKPFYMGKYEVTQAEYKKYCSYEEDKPSSTYGYGDNYPVYYVSWYDALVYCNKRSIAEGLTPCYSISGNTDPSVWGTVPTSSDSTWNAVICDWNANGYRLPTEAEWEYAARAGDNTVSSRTWAGTNSSSNLHKYAWYSENSSSETHNVGTKTANAFGLYDMSGNVEEWCWNWKTSSYNTDTEGGSDPTGASSGSSRVMRGNCFILSSSYCTVSGRSANGPRYRTEYCGFRVVCSAVVE